MDTLGRHLIGEFYGCDHTLLNDPTTVEQAICDAAHAVGATVLHVQAHRFAPQGVTATVIIAESHLSIHTWPEHGYAAADIFTCGGLDPAPGFRLLQQRLRAETTRVQVIVRGTDEHISRAGDLMPDDVVVLSSLAPLEHAPTLGTSS